MRQLLYYERNLPHRLPPGSDLFLTFRLAGSLPSSVVARLQNQFRSSEADSAELTYAQQRRYFGRFDTLLDGAAQGPVWLREPAVAEVVAASLRHFHGKAYHLVCYCIMPNHVHAVVSLAEDAPLLADTLQRLKGYTALQANKLLNRTGQFWQRETYDHIVRSGEEMQRVVAYVVNNPVKAGLAESWEQWPYTYWPDTLG
ncbi:transposase [Hymenobacter sp. ISL-91]|uniref:REP-associated tyrosine transposase n=1 Tax=Hymenobacter sp. ISL-91 TaxID=2819151 RepID=UPI001BEA5138|nr:transposase [Hymenobacter sp. ISL-91]MBT2556658.1 transposase [Hymenobacter sp. ISL-91]